ncbi:MAG: PqqD family protein [Candidatus Nanopelagicales bacterium]
MQDQVVIQRASGAVEAKVDDQVVLLSPLDFSYHALDPVGARIWSLLETPLTFGDLITELIASYSIDPDTCRADVTPFVERMSEIGVLTSSG